MFAACSGLYENVTGHLDLNFLIMKRHMLAACSGLYEEVTGHWNWNLTNVSAYLLYLRPKEIATPYNKFNLKFPSCTQPITSLHTMHLLRALVVSFTICTLIVFASPSPDGDVYPNCKKSEEPCNDSPECCSGICFRDGIVRDKFAEGVSPWSRTVRVYIR